ncbi:MAG: hypothetical protein IPG80_21490 [Anaerolineales bacterium]|uniref:hypothetical protein n=1 Tax=Candidatus Villigracilis vicinus TaxID=3140679 RepID=UPI00313521B9|nr:hypothetical protein [Anaerolineales bacterium]
MVHYPSSYSSFCIQNSKTYVLLFSPNPQAYYEQVWAIARLIPRGKSPPTGRSQNDSAA